VFLILGNIGFLIFRDFRFSKKSNLQ